MTNQTQQTNYAEGVHSESPLRISSLSFCAVFPDRVGEPQTAIVDENDVDSLKQAVQAFESFVFTEVCESNDWSAQDNSMHPSPLHSLRSTAAAGAWW